MELLIAVVFVALVFPATPADVVGGSGITLLAGIYSLKKLCTLVPLERLPWLTQRLIVLLRLAPPRGPDWTGSTRS